MKELFDFNFNSFVTPKIVKIVYILIIIGLGLMYLSFVIAAFASRQAILGFFVLIIIGPLVVLIYLALARMGLESLIATIRTAENTGQLVRLSGGNAPGDNPSADGSYPGGPQAPPANPYGNYPQA
ncbi:DUF4282 domain-containing protein [Paeniglutamicibacter antarcticus]|uniref:DUF4282 domain-containing protein n=1 Tax=Paeniglutamicibacter antarcticus TaxID=494023 RepID=A0ABP9TL93_9MICC